MKFPFRGVTGRDYPPTGLSTSQWRCIPATHVDFDEIWLTQHHIHVHALFDHPNPDADCDDSYPHVVDWAGALYLDDGHNRVMRAAAVHRQTGMAMRVYHA